MYYYFIILEKLLKKIDMLNHLGLEHINRQQFY